MTAAHDRSDQPGDTPESERAKSRRVPQIADCAPVSPEDWKATLPMIKKASAIDAVASDSHLSGGDIAVFIWVLRHADNEKWIAWPSHETLARLTQRSRRNVIDSVGRLIEAGYLERVSRGGPTRSSRYRLTLANAVRMGRWKDVCAQRSVGGEVQITTSDAIPGNVAGVDGVVNQASLGVVKSSVGGSEISRMGVVNPTSHEPIHEPEHQARVNMDGGSISSSAAAGAAPAGAGLPSAASELARGLMHEWFWAVYPIQEEAAAADDYLTQVLAAGVSRELIERKATEYAVSRRYTDHQFIKRPLTWLQKKGWVDGPKPNEVQPKTEAKKSAAKPREGTEAPRLAARKGSGGARQKNAARKSLTVKEPAGRRNTGLVIERVPRTNRNSEQARQHEESEAGRLVREQADAEAAELRRVAAEKAQAERQAAAALAESQGKQETAEKQQREAKETEATRARLLELRESVLSTFHPLDVADQIGVIGAHLIWAAEDAGCGLKTMDSVEHDRLLGRAFRNGPDDHEPFNRVFNELSGVELRRLLRGCEFRLDTRGRQ